MEVVRAADIVVDGAPPEAVLLVVTVAVWVRVRLFTCCGWNERTCIGSNCASSINVLLIWHVGLLLSPTTTAVLISKFVQAPQHHVLRTARCAVGTVGGGGPADGSVENTVGAVYATIAVPEPPPVVLQHFVETRCKLQLAKVPAPVVPSAHAVFMLLAPTTANKPP